MNLSLAIKAAFAVVCVVALWGIAGARPFIPERAQRPLLAVAFVGVRFTALLAWLMIQDIGATPDLTLYYLPQGRAVLAGEVPNVDFRSSYGPLFTYGSAALLWLWDRPVTLALAMYAAEALGLWCAWRAFRWRALPSATCNLVIGAYVLNPLAAWYVGVAAYQSALVMAFLCAALLVTERPFWNGLLYGIAVPATKLLALLAWPAAILRRRGIVAAAVGVLLGCSLLLPFVFAGQDIVGAALHEAGYTTNGNLWFLLSSLLGTDLVSQFPPLVLPLLFCAAYGSALTVALVTRRTWALADRPETAAALISFTVCLFLALSRKALPTYYPMILPMLIAVAMAAPSPRAEVLRIQILSAAGIVSPQIWSTWFRRAPFVPILDSASLGVFVRASTVFVLDLVTVSLGLYLAWRSWRLLVAAPRSVT